MIPLPGGGDQCCAH